MNRLIWLLGMSLIPLLTACSGGGGGGGGGGGTTPTLTISPTSATLTAGTGSQTFNATLSNATGTINWALSPNVGTLSATTGTSVTYTPPATVASSTTVQLTATSGTLKATANITVNPPANINVSGKVIDLRPVADASVVITYGGTNISTTTNASGVFSVSGITPPYDATVVSGNRSITYKGLTRPDPTLVFLDPTLVFPWVVLDASNSASLSGTVSGGAGFPQPANHRTRVAFGSPEVMLYTTAINTDTGEYKMEVIRWSGPTTTTGNIRALQWQFDGNNLPTDYTGYGELNVTLSDGGTFANQNVTMSGVSEATISGSVALPAGYNLVSKRMAVGFADRSFIDVLDEDLGASTSFTYTTPNVPGATIQMQITARNAAGTSVLTAKPGLAVNATDVSIRLPAGSDLIQPPDAATGVNNSTTFSYTPFSGGVHIVVFDGPGTNPDYAVVTTAASTTIPDLTSLGLGLPKSTDYSWRVVGVAPFATVDAAAGPGGWLAVFGGTAESSLTTSTRTFKTAP